MCKIGDKFIIEIGSEYIKNPFEDDENRKTPTILYKIKGFNSLVFDKNGLDRLEKYNENTDYEKGLNDVWECMKKIISMDISELNDIFNVCEWSSEDILENLTPQEAIDRLKEWEEKQEIKVGDVVDTGVEKFVVLQSDRYGVVRGFDEKGTLYGKYKDDVAKTGKHIDLTEIFKELEVM